VPQRPADLAGFSLCIATPQESAASAGVLIRNADNAASSMSAKTDNAKLTT
jgi:hypothetical protein